MVSSLSRFKNHVIYILGAVILFVSILVILFLVLSYILFLGRRECKIGYIEGIIAIASFMSSRVTRKRISDICYYSKKILLLLTTGLLKYICISVIIFTINGEIILFNAIFTLMICVIGGVVGDL